MNKSILDSIIPSQKKYLDDGVECHWDGSIRAYEISFFPPEERWGEIIGRVSIREEHIQIKINSHSLRSHDKTYKFYLADADSITNARAKLGEATDKAVKKFKIRYANQNWWKKEANNECQ